MMVWSGRLPGARTFGWPRSSRNEWPRFWRQTPVTGSHYAAAEALVEAVYERAAITLGVHGAEVGGVVAEIR